MHKETTGTSIDTVRAEELGVDYARAFFAERPQRTADLGTLRDIAKKELRRAHIGVSISDAAFIIAKECELAFIRGVQQKRPDLGLHATATPPLAFSQQDYHTIRESAKRQFPFHRYMPMDSRESADLRARIIATNDEHKLAKLRPFANIAQKARVVFLAGQFNIIVDTFRPSRINAIKTAVQSGFPIEDYAAERPTGDDLRKRIHTLDSHDAPTLANLLSLTTTTQQLDFMDTIEYHLRIREPRMREIREIQAGQLRLGVGF